MLDDMCRDASTQLLVNREVHDGSSINAGVRQGCPASGALFALALHVLTVELATVDSLDGASVAFRCGVFACAADDVAIKIVDFWGWIRRAGPVLDTFEMASALCAKPAKNLLVPPLGGHIDYSSARRHLGGVWPAWDGAPPRAISVFSWARA